jgi:hypothetical protein
MNDVTRILNAIDQGDPHAAGELLPLVYDELRKLAAQKLTQEAPGQTLQATALVHEAYTSPLRDWLGAFRSGTLVILDEAHHAAPASAQKYAVDSQITRAVRDLAPRFEHRLFLSATPHNGHSNSFSALLEILDPQRFCRGVP